MSAVRGVAAAFAVLVALLLQAVVFPHVALHGVVPDLCLLVVVAAAIARGAQTGMVLGFLTGALLDLAPPADHVAGRWALALLVVGWVAGSVRQEARPSATSVVATVGASAFLGLSVFALTGVLLADPRLPTGEVLAAIGLGVVYDLLLTPFVLPVLLAAFHRLESDRAGV